jgi:hypothetical protein
MVPVMVELCPDAISAIANMLKKNPVTVDFKTNKSRAELDAVFNYDYNEYFFVKLQILNLNFPNFLFLTLKKYH